MPPKVAAVTMAFNETVFLPIWARHYARQVGADHCYVVDHGSTEPIIVPPGVNTLRIPRSPHDDAKRADFIAALVTGLLHYYDWVIHTDVDEIALADPGRYTDLPALCAATPGDTVSAIGLDVQHVPMLEADLDAGRPVGQQRGWVRFTSAMCKPILTRRTLKWAPGFHSADTTLDFGELYLFHLHWADQAIGLQRLAKTRTMPWGDPRSGDHQRLSDGQWTALFQGMAVLPRVEDCAFEPDAAPMADWLDRTRASFRIQDGEPAAVGLNINAAELWAIPSRFRARL